MGQTNYTIVRWRTYCNSWELLPKLHELIFCRRMDNSIPVVHESYLTILTGIRNFFMTMGDTILCNMEPTDYGNCVWSILSNILNKLKVAIDHENI